MPILSLRRLATASNRKPLLILLGSLFGLFPIMGSANDFCPDIYRTGTFRVNSNPAFLSIGSMTHNNGNKYDGLLFTSFFNSVKNPNGVGVASYYERDLVARITGIGYRSQSWFNANRDVEILTDLDLATPIIPSAPGQTNWPNEAEVVPDGILPFEAVVVPQGFHPAGPPGRLTVTNLDDPLKQEYLIDQSVQDTTLNTKCRLPNAADFNPAIQPRFYHYVKWVDMDGDGLKDAVSVRSGFKVNTVFCLPPVGEVVWFKNPGVAIDPNTEWQEHVIAGFPTGTFSADITLDMYDFEGDGVPEVVGTHFFTGELIQLYGAPIGQTWVDVDVTTNPPRTAQISSDQGAPFGLKILDLNLDGKADILATNHQSDGCFSATQDVIPGRVYALEQPASGDIFNDPWITHILKDNIRPNPTYPAPTSGPGRLAPGLAQAFWPTPFEEAFSRPWILVGGDEASKVWLLKPNSQSTTDWTYASTVIFDINDTYGPNTSQSFSAPAPATGVSISTIGTPAWRYDRAWTWGSYAEIYIPIFEGRDIQRISFRPNSPAAKIVCPADASIACPAP